MGYEEEHRLLFCMLGVSGNGQNDFLSPLLSAKSSIGTYVGFPWGCSELEGSCSHPRTL